MTNIKEAITRLWAHVVSYGASILDQAKEYTDSKEVEINGAASTVVDSNLTTGMALVSDSSGKIAASSSITTTELGYLNGVSSNIQTQLNGKQATISGGASTIASSNLTASRALISNSSGKVAVSAVTSTELSYLDGVTSAIQTQLNGKVPTTRTINSKALSADITLTASDVGAATTAQGAKADTAVQLVSTGSENGTIAVDGTNVAVAGLGGAAYVSVDSIIESVKAQIGYTVVSDTAPTITNSNIIWVDTADSIAKYYDSASASWIALGAVWK